MSAFSLGRTGKDDGESGSSSAAASFPLCGDGCDASTAYAAGVDPHLMAQWGTPMSMPMGAEDGSQPSQVLTGVAGMEMINDMLQRQARRLETQFHQQDADRKMIDFSQAQLLVMQAQLQWHAQHCWERAEQVTKSSDTISRMESYIAAMNEEQANAVQTAQHLAHSMVTLREHMAVHDPQRLKVLSASLSDISAVGTNLSQLQGLGSLFANHQSASKDSANSAQWFGSERENRNTASSTASTTDAATQATRREGAEARYHRRSASASRETGHDSPLGSASVAGSSHHTHSGNSGNSGSDYASQSDSADAASAASTNQAIALKRKDPSQAGTQSAHASWRRPSTSASACGVTAPPLDGSGATDERSSSGSSSR
jgi:hypothetical protein